MVVTFALLAAVVAGSSDFLGGFASRTAKAVTVTAFSHGVAVVFVAALLGPAIGGDPVLSDWIWGGLSGIGGGFGIVALYRGIASGHAGTVSPISAVGAAGVPVVVDLMGGASIGAVAVSGLVLGLVSIGLVSRQPNLATGASRSAVLHGLGGAAGLGFMLVALGQATDDAGIWPLFPSRVVSTALVAALAVATAQPVIVSRPARLTAAVAGIGGAATNALFILAVQRGSLATASVLTSMYPVATVMWARIILGQRLGRTQLLGLAVALTAVGLIARG